MATALLVVATGCAPVTPAAFPATAADEIRVWLTTADGSTVLLAEQPALEVREDPAVNGTRVHLQPGRTYQRMEGFGASLTESSATLLDRHPSATRCWPNCSIPATPRASA